ncbi:hemagglutinin [Archangium violaceum]|uniref:adventurous gliding motility protein AgmC n=1 Tax=Archangium violaceum TaxID=83451 RepID=UPI00194E9E46|nr:hemagglutinin [Archangium violaceum]QRN98073.1 hemagglutinin [Archangium violaceum]
MSPATSRRFVPVNPRGVLLGLLSVGLALLPGGALAEKDVFGLGNGQQGSLQVRDSGDVINASTALTADAPAGTTRLRVENATPFDEGELVLVLQVGETVSLEQARVDAFDLEGSRVGRWELARLEDVSTGVLRLSAPLVNDFTLPSQVVLVPEYTDVRISSSGSLRAPPWNGRSGGVLAFLATGTVFNQGSLDVEGLGFRGGAAEAGVAESLYDCTEQDGPATRGGGARKGEGFASRLYDALSHGYARFANGGGGGNCHDAGGGGGGHVGRGGQGGRSSQESPERDVGGRGGMALRYSRSVERLLFGGGGGAGIEGSAGGAGGGIVFVRAREIQGPRPRGIITANGLAALAATASQGGGGGGGAGGTVHVRVAEGLGCTVLSAKGGAGADGTASPGGGGGGGLVLVQAAGGVPSECTASASAGLSGDTPEGPRGAEPTVAGAPDFEGRVEVIAQAFAAPAVPTWVSPGNGEAGVSSLPQLEGRTAPGATVQVFLDGSPVGAPVVADASGGFVFVPPEALAEGAHEAQARAEQFGMRSALSAPLGFSVGGLLNLRVGFGCGVASGGGAWGLGLAVLAWLLGRARHSRA